MNSNESIAVVSGAWAWRAIADKVLKGKKYPF